MDVWLLLVVLLVALAGTGFLVSQYLSKEAKERGARLEIRVGSTPLAEIDTTAVKREENIVSLVVTNVGEADNTLQTIFLELESGSQVKINTSFKGRPLLLGDRQLPCRLSPGESATFGLAAGPTRAFLEDLGYQLGDQPVVVNAYDVKDQVYSTELNSDTLR